jgi:hypothetical protein
VSLFWRDEIGIYLCPHRLCLVRMEGGLRPRRVCEEQQTLSAGTTGWEAILQLLSRQLAAPEWPDARVRAVIGDRWVRYAIVPWSDSLMAAGEQMAHARERMRMIFGDDLAEWTVTLSEAPPGQTRVACAMPNVLLDGLRMVVDEHGKKLISVQPQLIAAYNSWRHRFAVAEPVWFVTVEKGTLAALLAGTKGINRVHAVRIGADWGRELKRLQTISRLGGVSPMDGRVYVDAPRTLRAALSGMSEHLIWLDDEEPLLTTLHQLENLRRHAA